jgi:uncharacterized phiE125 gp8 family phage protein
MSDTGRLRLVTDATDVPVALADAKSFCRVDDSTSDALIGGLIAGATKRVEQETGLALLTQTWIYVMDAWPGQRTPGRSIETEWWDGMRDGAISTITPAPVIKIPKRPFQSVVSFQLRDYTGAFVTVDPSIYYTEASGYAGRLIRNPTVPWPVVILAPNSALEIQFKAGFADAQGGSTPLQAVPADLLTAIKMLVAHWFENREPMQGGRVAEMPYHVQSLIQSWRNARLQ